MITIEQLILEVRRLAKESPENKYTPELADETASLIKACFYNKGKCTNGAVGCIFGQAFRNLGSPIPLVYDNGNGAGIKSIFAGLDITHPNQNLIEWCLEAQRNQDSSYTWEKCITEADIYYYASHGSMDGLPVLTESVIDINKLLNQ
jgi:hypothetical protein